MSFVHVPEPLTKGRVLLKTTVGDIEIGLWTKESPKASRNFIQLCLDGYYNNNNFYQIKKGFIALSGDATNTGDYGKSIYGEPFKDQFHSRLKFNKRGLIATANSNKDCNDSRFFFTLSATPELQGKHTLFGRVLGESIYNLIKLDECEVNSNDVPIKPEKILETVLIENPFPDSYSRVKHLLLDTNKRVVSTESDSNSEDEEDVRKRLTLVKKKKLAYNSDKSESSDEQLSDSASKDSNTEKRETNSPKSIRPTQLSESVNVTNTNKKSELNKEERLKKTKEELEKVRQELKGIRQQIEDSHKVSDKGSSLSRTRSKTEIETLNKLNDFCSKLRTSKSNSRSSSFRKDDSIIESNEDINLCDLEKADSEEWLTHKFNVEKDLRLAKDANLKTSDWYSVEDPRHSFNQRGRDTYDKSSSKRRL